MKTAYVAIALVAILLVIVVSILLMLRKRKQKRLSPESFQDKWKDIQKQCANKDTWPDAVAAADTLLDEALKKKRFRGKTAGERLTKAQRVLTNNEAVWFGHKLRSKIESGVMSRLQEKDVKQALVGIRQALKDLGALKSNDK